MNVEFKNTCPALCSITVYGCLSSEQASDVRRLLVRWRLWITTFESGFFLSIENISLRKYSPNIGYVLSNILIGLKLILSNSEPFSRYLLFEPKMAIPLIPLLDSPFKRPYAIFSKPPMFGGKKCETEM